jgi:hypothetical protein
MMVYIEVVDRSLEEQQEYEFAMTEFNETEDVLSSVVSQRTLDKRSHHIE